jgi:TrmH family RNA methyltransferase
MGSLFRTRVKVVSDFQDFLLRESKSLVLANMEGEPLSTFQFPKEAIMVLGNEGQGLSAKIQNLTEAQKVNIPGSGNAESLNVSVAAGIFAWQYYQQNHVK